MACTLIGGTAAGTVLTLMFLPALYAIWFRVRKPASHALTAAPLASDPMTRDLQLGAPNTGPGALASSFAGGADNGCEVHT